MYWLMCERNLFNNSVDLEPASFAATAGPHQKRYGALELDILGLWEIVKERLACAAEDLRTKPSVTTWLSGSQYICADARMWAGREIDLSSFEAKKYVVTCLAGFIEVAKHHPRFKYFQR